MAKTRIKREGSVPRKTWNQSLNWDSREPNISSSVNDEYVEGNILTSTGNWGWQHLRDTSGATGGDFAVVKREHKWSSGIGGSPMHFSNTTDPMYRGPGTGGHYYGTLRARTTGSVQNGLNLWPTAAVSSGSTMDQLGTKAIGITAPTNPLFNAAAFLGELREGIPSAVGASQWQGRALTAKNAGDEYLNVEFGWKPLASDIQKFAYAVSNAEKTLDQYEKNSGKSIKRRFFYPGTTTTKLTVLDSKAAPEPALIATVVDGVKKYGKLEQLDTVERKQWFAGAFTYYLPPRGTAAGNLARANKLYGVRLTPEVLWQLTPWSWAADWFTNIGDVAKNVSLFSHDGLVLRYGYMMEEIIATRTFTLTGVELKSYPGTCTFTEMYKTTYKSRRVANPFGFGSSWTGMTGRQKAIVAALGLSRSR